MSRTQVNFSRSYKVTASASGTARKAAQDKDYACTATLVDELGKLTEQLKLVRPLLKREAELKEQLKAAVQYTAKGKKYEIEMVRTAYPMLDVEKIKQKMSALWIRRFSKDVEKCTIRIKKLTKAN